MIFFNNCYCQRLILSKMILSRIVVQHGKPGCCIESLHKNGFKSNTKRSLKEIQVDWRGVTHICCWHKKFRI